MPKLRCVSRYVSARRVVECDETIEVSDIEARFLLNDAPGCWVDEDTYAERQRLEAERLAEEERKQREAEKAPTKPAKDKMIKGAPEQK